MTALVVELKSKPLIIAEFTNIHKSFACPYKCELNHENQRLLCHQGKKPI